MSPDDAIKITIEAMKKNAYNRRSLPHALQVVHLISWLNFEVMQGGVYGWLINSGEHGPDTVKAFDAIGAHRCAAIVHEILAFFPGGIPSSDDRERVQQMEDVGEIGEKSWRALGNELLAWPDDIQPLLQQFINDHEADFT